MNKIQALFFLLMAVCLCDIAGAAQMPADANLQMEGRAVISKNDMAGARQAAVKNAQEKAILEVAAKLLSDRASDEKFQALKSMLIGKTERYVKNYRIISETSHQNEYVASVNIVVVQAAVRDDLIRMGILHDKEKPNDAKVHLSLKGVKKYADFAQLKIFLQSRAKIVKSIYPCSLEWRNARCELVITGGVPTLVAELETTGRYDVETPARTNDADVINLRMKEEAQ